MKTFINRRAIGVIRKIIKSCEIGVIHSMIIKEWEEKKNCMCYVNENENSFLLIHKTNYDPENLTDNLHVVDFIYTKKEHRNKGYAEELLNWVSDRDFIIFCDNDKSKNLMRKMGFKCYDLDGLQMIFRNH